MKSARTITVFIFFAWIFSSIGCAHFTVPAPAAPIKPAAEPIIEDSVVNLPLSVSLKSLMDIIGGKLSASKNSDDHDENQALAGKIRKFLNRQVTKIDNNNFMNNVFIREGASTAWNALQYPIPLKNGLALLLNPQAVRVPPPSTQQEQGDTVTVVIGLVVRPKIVDDTLLKQAVQPIPRFSTAPTGSGFHVALESELSYDFLSHELAKRLESQVFMIDGDRIKVKMVKIYGAGDSVILQVRIAGTIYGTIYLSGIPAYDEPSRCLYVRNLDYTMETKQVLAKAGDWIFHSRIRETLEDKAKWYVGDKIDEAVSLLTKALNRSISQHVALSGNVYSIRPVAVGLTDGALKTVVVADGAVELKLL